MATAPKTRSARELLVEWANSQDGWVRAIVGEAVLTRRELSVDVLKRLKGLFLIEKQLVGGEPIDAPFLADSSTDEDARQPLRLLSLSDCRGVNALAADQTITFNPRMTILFGENAVGKTGYVRVLKQAANVRSAEAIIPDVHRATPAPSPEAVVRYAIGDVADELIWRGEAGVAPLTRLAVFDAPAVALHLEDNVTYVYTPADLALFRYVHSAIEGVRSLLDQERTARDPKHNPFMTAFTRDSSLYPKIEQLGAPTDLSELEALAVLSSIELGEIDALKVSIEALRGAGTTGKTEMLRSRIAVLSALSTLAAAVAEHQPDELAAALAEQKRAEHIQETAAAAVFGGEALPNSVRPAWQAFLEAGEGYLRSRELNAYPDGTEPCIYCRQALGDSAAGLLRSYRDYAAGTAAATVATAIRRVHDAQEGLHSPQVDSALEILHTMLPPIEENDQAPAWTTNARALADFVTEVRLRLGGDIGAATESSPPAGADPNPYAGALRETQATLKAVEGDASQRTAVLAERQTRLATLEARVTLARLLPEIRAYVESASWASRVRLLLGRFPALLRSLTEISKLASEEVLNRNFERAFYEECEALRAPNVTLGFPGRRGQAARHKSVTTDHTLRAILSEGEQKVIAVADFLAEASFRGGAAPVVFDDPVTSLDHRRIHELVRRIVKLSEQHQVVVFTHDIWFTSELLSQFQDDEKACSFYQVVERSGVKGVITGGMHPRIDTPSRIAGRINKALQGAKAASDTEQVREIEAAYDHVRAWCEAVVEKELLGGVTRCYQPNVAMGNLKRIKPGRLAVAIAAISPIYERACRYIPGHSQPMPTLGVRPTVDELDEDWRALQEARKQYAAP